MKKPQYVRIAFSSVRLPVLLEKMLMYRRGSHPSKLVGIAGSENQFLNAFWGDPKDYHRLEGWVTNMLEDYTPETYAYAYGPLSMACSEMVQKLPSEEYIALQKLPFKLQLHTDQLNDRVRPTTHDPAFEPCFRMAFHADEDVRKEFWRMTDGGSTSMLSHIIPSTSFDPSQTDWCLKVYPLLTGSEFGTSFFILYALRKKRPSAASQNTTQ